MMEGYRASGDYAKSLSYFNLFQRNKLQPDKYVPFYYYKYKINDIFS